MLKLVVFVYYILGAVKYPNLGTHHVQEPEPSKDAFGMNVRARHKRICPVVSCLGF